MYEILDKFVERQRWYFYYFLLAFGNTLTSVFDFLKPWRGDKKAPLIEEAKNESTRNGIIIWLQDVLQKKNSPNFSVMSA